MSTAAVRFTDELADRQALRPLESWALLRRELASIWISRALRDGRGQHGLSELRDAGLDQELLDDVEEKFQ